MVVEHSFTAGEECPRITWDTKFCTTKDEVTGWRYINGRPYKLVVSINLDDTITDVFEKYDRLSRIEDGMFRELSDIAKRVRLEAQEG